MAAPVFMPGSKTEQTLEGFNPRETGWETTQDEAVETAEPGRCCFMDPRLKSWAAGSSRFPIPLTLAGLSAF